MGEIIRRPTKPLQVNPIRLTQPMGAALAFLGIDRCMPLMHGGMGCTSFTKVFLTRHFCAPIDMNTKNCLIFWGRHKCNFQRMAYRGNP